MGPRGDKGLPGFYGKKGSMDHKTKCLYWSFNIMGIDHLNFSPMPHYSNSFYSSFSGIYSEQWKNGKIAGDCSAWWSIRIHYVTDHSELLTAYPLRIDAMALSISSHWRQIILFSVYLKCALPFNFSRMWFLCLDAYNNSAFSNIFNVLGFVHCPAKIMLCQ